jgi:PadR family transcriptional regulator, regulatory protein PadR
MPPRDNLGEFEQFVLLAVLRLKGEAYGMRVRQEIETRTERPTSIGAVYATLDRLEAKGLVRSEIGESTPLRGGRPKKVFGLTALGSEALQRSMDALSKMRQGIKMGDLEWLA